MLARLTLHLGIRGRGDDCFGCLLHRPWLRPHGDSRSGSGQASRVPDRRYATARVSGRGSRLRWGVGRAARRGAVRHGSVARGGHAVAGCRSRRIAGRGARSGQTDRVSSPFQPQRSLSRDPDGGTLPVLPRRGVACRPLSAIPSSSLAAVQRGSRHPQSFGDVASNMWCSSAAKLPGTRG